MRVDYQKNNKTWSYLHYNQFSVGSANEEYPLTVGGFIGINGNHFEQHNRLIFATVDNDNGNNCAAQHKSGWWYHSCYSLNINEQPPNIYRW